MSLDPESERRRHLAVLGLERGAKPSAIRAAFVDLVRVWHPDRFPSDPALAARATERLKAINAAYDWLRAHPELIPQSGADEPRAEVATPADGEKRPGVPSSERGGSLPQSKPLRRFQSVVALAMGGLLLVFMVGFADSFLRALLAPNQHGSGAGTEKRVLSDSSIRADGRVVSPDPSRGASNFVDPVPVQASSVAIGEFVVSSLRVGRPGAKGYAARVTVSRDDEVVWLSDCAGYPVVDSLSGADLDHDGTPDLIVHDESRGSGGYESVIVVSLSQACRVLWREDNLVGANFEDVDGDAVYEVVTYHFVWGGAPNFCNEFPVVYDFTRGRGWAYAGISQRRAYYEGLLPLLLERRSDCDRLRAGTIQLLLGNARAAYDLFEVDSGPGGLFGAGRGALLRETVGFLKSEGALPESVEDEVRHLGF